MLYFWMRVLRTGEQKLGLKESSLLTGWIGALAPVDEAVKRFEGKGVAWISVLGEEGFRGVVDYAQLLTMDPAQLVFEAEIYDVPVADATAAEAEHFGLLAESLLGLVAVYRDQVFLGLLSAEVQFAALASRHDATTGLPWCGYLRTWTAEQLAKGREVCVLLLDIPSFAGYNREFGYDAGDSLLRDMAAALGAALDSQTDTLVRFSGDAFAVATTRTRVQANALASRLLVALSRQAMPEAMPNIAIVGGQRTTPRPMDSIAATVDNLIRLARDASQGIARASRSPRPTS